MCIMGTSAGKANTGDTPTSSHMKIAPAAAVILGMACAAPAHENKRDEQVKPDWREWLPPGSRNMDNGNTDFGLRRIARLDAASERAGRHPDD